MRIDPGPVLTVLSLTAGCSIPHTMTPTPQGRECPARTASGAPSWIFPQEAADGRTLEEWCHTVGPAVIDSTPHASFGPWLSGDSLAVVAWNINAGSGTIFTLLETELRLDCTAGSPARHPGFAHFVLLAQEAYRRASTVPTASRGAPIPPRTSERERSGDRIDIVEVARRCGLAFAYVPSMRNGPEDYDDEREDWGNAILSSLPLSEVTAIELPFEASRRVAVAATVATPGGDLRAVSVHLSTFPGPWRMLRTGNSSRLRQALGLVEALTAGEGEPSIPTILGGDLNTWASGETTLKHLRRHFPDAPRLDEATRGPFPTDHLLMRYGSDAPSSPHVLPGSARRIGDSYNSDHHGLRLWIGTG